MRCWTCLRCHTSATRRIFLADDVMPKFFLKKFRIEMRQLRATPLHITIREKYLYETDYVFIRVDHIKRPLDPPWDGPFRRQSEYDFVVDACRKDTVINVNRLNLHFYSPMTFLKTRIHVLPATYLQHVTAPLVRKADMFSKHILALAPNTLLLSYPISLCFNSCPYYIFISGIARWVQDARRGLCAGDKKGARNLISLNNIE